MVANRVKNSDKTSKKNNFGPSEKIKGAEFELKDSAINGKNAINIKEEHD